MPKDKTMWLCWHPNAEYGCAHALRKSAMQEAADLEIDGDGTWKGAQRLGWRCTRIELGGEDDGK
jgi:hypothetical protein